MEINCFSHSKIHKKKFLHLFVYFLSVLALLVFLYGFFPFKYNSNLTTNRFKSGIKNVQRRYVDKLALIIIDALRYDFVMPPDDQKYDQKYDQKFMPFTMSSILKRESCAMVTKAHAPTVTLPRLKAITSGSVSSYIDVILNFMTPAFEEDNFINTAVSKGLKLVFYGDDTWLKLFPTSFIRSEGTHSFFTYDYNEVDSNVSRHIPEELKNNDWDIIILHYLGLDHIGHTEGPNSGLIKPKLVEMDNVVKQFHHHFQQLEKDQGLKTMLIVTGDHGMKDSGSHGGITYPEVTVPLVSVGNPCVVLPGWPLQHTPLQIDIASTLSALFGLPIPAGNMGKLIPDLLYNMQTDDILKHLEIIRLELSKLKSTSDAGSKINPLRAELEHYLFNSNKSDIIGKNLAEKYFKSLNEMSQELVTSKADFKMIFLFIGVISIWICEIQFLFQFFKQCPKPRACIHWFIIIANVLHALSLPSSSFVEEEHQVWYFFWATFCILSIIEVLQLSKSLTAVNMVRLLIPWISLIIMHRILRKLNQTGDKWALLPDIKFYLHSEEGHVWLFILFLLGIGLVFWCAILEKCPILQLVTYALCLLVVIAYRVSTEYFKMQYLMYPPSRGLSEVFLFWIFLAVFTIQTVHNRKPLYLVWLAFSSLLLRPHNVILLPAHVYVSKRLYKLFHKPEDIVWNNMSHILLGNLFYFYQGNGNTLSNVDVAAGFIGVQTYKPVYAGFMIASHTFCGYILSFILSPKSDLLYAVTRILPLAMYCTTLLFLLNHLFIWSVFSPKLLFESSITALFFLLLVCNHVIGIIKFCIKLFKY